MTFQVYESEEPMLLWYQFLPKMIYSVQPKHIKNFSSLENTVKEKKKQSKSGRKYFQEMYQIKNFFPKCVKDSHNSIIATKLVQNGQKT